MRRKHLFLQGLTDRLDLPGEALPGVTVAELWGGGKVLVENHRGILGYSEEEILIGSSFGYLRITGSRLQMTKMTGDQVIISGKIETLSAQEKKLC